MYTDPQIVLVIVTVLVGVTAEFLVSSINGLVESNPALSAEWVGLILLPIVSGQVDRADVQVGNAAEHFTAVSVSVKDKLDLSISVAASPVWLVRNHPADRSRSDRLYRSRCSSSQSSSYWRGLSGSP